MAVFGEINRSLRGALTHADRERRRAARAAEVAERHEQQALTDPQPLHEFHLRLAAMHRQVQRQHLAAARIHASHAARLQLWLDSAEGHPAEPRFMASVADAAEADGAAVTLFGSGLVEYVTAASDTTTKAAQDVEFTLGEGPARDAMSGRRALRAAGSGVCRRWPNYGPEVARLGIRSVAAVPVDLTGVPFGALTLFGLRPARTSAASLRTIAGAVATMLVTERATSATDDEATSNPVLAGADHRAVIHQATGIVSVECACSIPNALALIRARAFADDRPIESVASDIVDRTLRLP